MKYYLYLREIIFHHERSSQKSQWSVQRLKFMFSVFTQFLCHLIFQCVISKSNNYMGGHTYFTTILLAYYYVLFYFNHSTMMCIVLLGNRVRARDRPAGCNHFIRCPQTHKYWSLSLTAYRVPGRLYRIIGMSKDYII